MYFSPQRGYSTGFRNCEVRRKSIKIRANKIKGIPSENAFTMLCFTFSSRKVLNKLFSHEMALQYGKRSLSLLNQVLKMAKITCKSQLNKIKVEKEKNTGMKEEMLAFS